MTNLFGRYEIIREVGRGGMAVVYLAHDPRFKRDVAIKVLPAQFTHDPKFRARFEREAQTIASLEHEAIVPVYDFGEYEAQPYLVMRYMANGSLAERIPPDGMTLNDILPIVRRIAPALDKAHQRGIIHRDLKPGNILFDEDDKAYIADFGVVKLAEASTTLTMGTVGTPQYMSPEQGQAKEELDGRSDIYALGVITYQLLSGTLPFNANTPMGLIYAHVNEPLPDIQDVKPQISDHTKSVLGKSLEKERGQRYQTALEFVMAFDELAQQEAKPSQAQSSSQQSAAPSTQLLDEPLPKARQKKNQLVKTPPKKPSRGWLWALGCGGVGMIAIVMLGFVMINLNLLPNLFTPPLDMSNSPTECANDTDCLNIRDDEATLSGTGGESVCVSDCLDRALAGEFSGELVTMLGPFRDVDAIKFNNSVASFEEATGIDIQYEDTYEFESSITIRVDAGDPPHIVDFPQPGLMANFAGTGEVVDVTTFLPASALANYNDSWNQMATVPGPDGDIQAGVFHRFNGKSLVWYPIDDFKAAGYTIPETWDDLIALSDQIVADGDTPWCVGIESGAATGWVATDWMEEIMLRTTSLDNYDAWVAGDLAFSSPEVIHAGEVLTEVWSEEYVFGGTTAIVPTFFGDAPTPMFEDPPRCWLHKQGNFITSFFPEGAEAGVDYGFFYLPSIDEAYGKPFLVAGDIMSLFKDTNAARAVMHYFTQGEAVKEWLAAGGALSPHLDAELSWYGNDVERGVAEIVAASSSFRFDASDLMPQEVGQGAFWEEMTNYFSGTIDLETALSNIDASWPR